MPTTAVPCTELVIELPDLGATQKLAEALARLLRAGDVVCLSGELGSGKTTLARAVIAAAARSRGAPPEEVPSPTFTMVQTYDLPGLSIWHFDLFRLARPQDALELGLEEAFASAVSLIEWPERLGPLLPAEHLAITLELGREETRRAHIRGTGAWAGRLRGLKP